MKNTEKDIITFARQLGFPSEKEHPFELAEWLREEKQIHVEVGSIWDELMNLVESYCYTITAPVFTYYTDPVYASGGKSYNEMLHLGLYEAVKILHTYNRQKDLIVTDDQVVIAFLKGYGDKEKVNLPEYSTNIEKYAYLQGKQGDYINDGLTEDDILFLLTNKKTHGQDSETGIKILCKQKGPEKCNSLAPIIDHR